MQTGAGSGNYDTANSGKYGTVSGPPKGRPAVAGRARGGTGDDPGRQEAETSVAFPSQRRAVGARRGGEGSMYDSMKRHEVHVLKKAGLTLDAIARTTGMSRRTVARIARRTPEPAESPPLVTSERPVGRPSCSNPYAGLVRKTLEAEPDLPTVELLHRARNAGYEGGKTALYALATSLRTGTVSPIVRFEGLAGEFSQHDFGQVDVRYYGTGKTERIHFFASRLKWSRWSHVALVPDERGESLVRSLLSAYEDFQGFPLVSVFDNPKTIVLSREGSRIEWNPTFAQVMIDFPVNAVTERSEGAAFAWAFRRPRISTGCCAAPPADRASSPCGWTIPAAGG
jgi:transposase